MECVYQIYIYMCVCVCVCVKREVPDLANHVDESIKVRSEIRGGKKKRKRKANSLLIATFYLPKFWRERDRGRERE